MRRAQTGLGWRMVTGWAVLILASLAAPLQSAAQELDFGDAPLPYPTLLANNGARHTQSGVGAAGLRLGDQVDTEADGQPSPGADGDDTNNLDDEDGVVFLNPIVPGQQANVILKHASRKDGYINAWVDFNRDGDWADAGERVFTDFFAPSNGWSSTSFAVPASAVLGTSYARFRIATVPGLSYTGAAADGEVEDYRIDIATEPAHKMHYIQWPNPYGWDVMDTVPVILADDFQCSSNGLITKVTFWGAWSNDVVGVIQNVKLSIHADNSGRVGRELWSWNTAAANVTQVLGDAGQWWLDPREPMQWNTYESSYYKCTAVIPEAEAFYQIAGTTYWLDIQITASGGNWGWKTSAMDVFGAAAMWGFYDPQNPDQVTWDYIDSPYGFGQLGDLAFWIDGVAGAPPESFDFGDARLPFYPTLLYDNGARHAQSPVGPRMGALIDYEFDGAPTVPADGDDLANLDDEDGVTFLNALVPGSNFTMQVDFTSSPSAGFLNVWIDFGMDGSWSNDPAEHVATDVPFAPGMKLVVPGTVPATAYQGATYARFRVSTQQGLASDGLAPDGEVEDYMVRVTSGVQAEPKMHYPQWPDPNGWDVKPFFGFLGDDFRCTSNGLITEITFWGSWKDDVVGTVQDVQLWIYSDDRSGPFSRPGTKLWSWSDLTPDTREMAPSWQGWYDPSMDTVLPQNHQRYFQYTVTVPPGNAFRQTEGTIYWLVLYVWTENGEWGWKTSRAPLFEDDAVWGTQNGGEYVWNEIHNPTNTSASLDLAFMIDGVAEPVVSDLDYGDAPETTYPTLLASDGARHAPGRCWLGWPDDVPDVEADGQPSGGALADDTDTNGDDEDGVWFPLSGLIQGVPGNVELLVSSGDGAGGWVRVWLDDDGGGWDAGDLVIDGHYTNGQYFIPVTVPVGAVSGMTYARARISSQQGLPPSGYAADGEVEDHAVTIIDGYPDWGNLQWPPATTTEAGTPTGWIYGQVWDQGVTDQPGQAPNMIAQLGYGPDGTDPDGNPAWTWVTASYNLDVGNNDEYMAQLTVPTPGTYDYAYRYSRNGAQWIYGDQDGSNNGYDVANAGDLVVTARPLCPKWAQGPDCERGVDLESYGSLAEPQPVYLVADDWRCDGRPITAIRWWGSYVGWPALEPPETRPLQFRLTWYGDIPAGVEGEYSRPGEAITNVLVTLLPFGASEGDPGQAVERAYCATDLSWMQPRPPVPFAIEQEFEYYCELPAEWIEKEGTVYWLSIEAVYPGMQILSYPWGWKTTPPEQNWNDDAVVREAAGPVWKELTYPPQVPPWSGITNWPYAGLSVNMAFELLTDVCPRRAKKWAQPPDLWRGTDSASYAPADQDWVTPWPLRADDFVSDGRRITDLHWWGSYLGWRQGLPGGRTVAPPSDPSQALQGFEIAWQTDLPKGDPDPFSQPANPPLKRMFVPVSKCHEVYYGTVTQTWAGVYEHEYQYYVDLLDPEVGKPWYETNGVVYWLTIQAVFPPTWEPEQGGGATEPPHRGWGWLSTHPKNNWNDISVVATNVTAGGPDWRPGLYQPPNHPWRVAGEELNLAFELTTDEPGTSRWSAPIEFTVIEHPASNRFSMGTVGDCGAGVQVLQSCTNLLGPVWVDLKTNALPHWPPTTNWWFRDEPNRTSLYYRVKQR